MNRVMDTIKSYALKIQIGTIIAVVLFIIGATSYFVERFKDIEAEQKLSCAKSEQIEEQLEANKIHITTLEAKTVEANLDRVKILTKLEGIEVSLLEIKKDLK